MEVSQSIIALERAIMYNRGMNRHFRVSATPADLSVSTTFLHLDVVLNGAGEIVDEEAILGFEGSVRHKTGKCAPFVLYPDGTLDYGHEVSGGDYVTLDIRKTPITVGTRLELNYNGDPRGYQVVGLRER
jgi:hypothetical protein